VPQGNLNSGIESRHVPLEIAASSGGGSMSKHKLVIARF
jgi:hypothetical protein